MTSVPKIGISMGDINGISLEVILKSLNHPSIFNICTPIIYGNGKIVAYHKNIVEYDDLQFNSISRVSEVKPGKINVVNVWKETVNIEIGKPTQESGKYAFISLEAAVKDLNDGHIDALVTAPINKAAMKMSGFKHIGHTEYLTEMSSTSESLMLMVSDAMKVGIVTAHIPLRDVANKVTKELVKKKLQLLRETMQRDFGISKPQIAVLGLNPHAGDDGNIGKEDIDIIRPVIIEEKKDGQFVYGPYGADGFFGSGDYKKFDAILAMYHDQGLIPFKTLSFGQGVNYSAGLSFVRTSPDHGTAYQIAGGNQADHHSFLKAMYTAIDISKTRAIYDEDNSNKLVQSKKRAERG